MKKYRPDVHVSRHGDYCNNASKNTLGITFGNSKKVYDYHGSYLQILRKFDCPVVSSEDIYNAKLMLKSARERNGTMGFFGTVNDTTKDIEYWEKWLKDAEEMEIV